MTDRNAIHLSTGVDFPRAGMDSIMLWGGGPTLSEFSIEFLSHIPNRREKALIIFSLFLSS